MSAAAEMRKGQGIAATSPGRKTPTAGDVAANAFVTWSSPKSGGRWCNPASSTRQDFAVILVNCWGELVDAEGATNPPAPEIAVPQEDHKDGGIYYHAILGAPRNKLWRHLPTLLRDRRVPRDVEIGIGAGAKHSDNMLRYCAAPTLGKFDLDPTPFFPKDSARRPISSKRQEFPDPAS